MQLFRRQQLEQLPTHKLLQEVETRWNSTYTMMERLLEQQTAVDSVLRRTEYEDLLLTSDEWITVKLLLEVLKPFKTATDFAQQENNASLSIVRPTLLRLKNYHTRVTANDSILMRTVKATLGTELARHLAMYDNRHNGEQMAAAIMLDPRFKNLEWMGSGSAADKMRATFKKHILETFEIEASGAVPPPAKKAKKQEDLEFLFGTPKKSGTSQSLEGELAAYFLEPAADFEVSPLEWWKNQSRFPTLALADKRYLCIPATSAPSERVFSTAGYVVSDRRTCLDPDRVDAILFLHG